MERKYFLETERIGFSKWEPTDIELASSLWGNRDVTRFFSSNGMSSEMIQKRLDFELTHYDAFCVQYFPLFLLDTGEFMGCCGLRTYDSEPGDLDESVYELGCHLLPLFWGKGYAREASEAMIDYGFRTFPLTAILAGHHPDNAASAQLLKKMSFVFSEYFYYPPTGLNHPCYLRHNSL